MAMMTTGRARRQALQLQLVEQFCLPLRLYERQLRRLDEPIRTYRQRLEEAHRPLLQRWPWGAIVDELVPAPGGSEGGPLSIYPLMLQASYAPMTVVRRLAHKDWTGPLWEGWPEGSHQRRLLDAWRPLVQRWPWGALIFEQLQAPLRPYHDPLLDLAEAIVGYQQRLLAPYTGLERWLTRADGPGADRLYDGERSLRHPAATTPDARWEMTHDGAAAALAWSPDGAWLATAGSDRTVRVVDAANGAERWRADLGDYVSAVAWSPDGAWLALSNHRTVRVVDAASGAERCHVAPDGTVYDTVQSVAWSPDGAWLAIFGTIHRQVGPKEFSATDTVWVIDAASGKERWRAAGGGAVAWSPDGAWLATAGPPARVLDAASGAERCGVSPDVSVAAVAWSPDGAWLAVAGYTTQVIGPMAASMTGTVRMVDAASGKERYRVTQDHRVWGVEWSPGGTRLATTGLPARVIDAASGAQRFRVAPHRAVQSVAWSPDGAWLAATSGAIYSDGPVWLIDAASGKELCRITHDDSVLALAWSPDGAWLATATAAPDGTVRCWPSPARALGDSARTASQGASQ